MQIKNKKISELEEAQDMNGFFTIGYRIVNGVKTSLKFGLEKVQIAYDGMLAIKDNALDAICDIRALEEVVETSESNRVIAEQDRKTEYGGVIQSLKQAGETSSAQTALAKNAADAANAAAASANNAVTGIDAKMQAAIDALIAGAPGALDTLNELAAALGNDPNFATTVLNELGKKLNRADIINDLVSGGIDKPFSAEMGKSLKSFLDTHNHDGKYQPISNDIAKVYNTTLDVFGIQDGSVVTKEQSTEVSNIMDKWNQGYIVTYVDTRQNSFHYGVLNVCRCDDGVPTSLSVINDRGELMAYSFEPSQLERWNVSNISKGNSYYLMTKGLLDNMNQDNFSLNFNDIRTLESMRHTNNSLIDAKAFFSGKDNYGQQMLVSLNFLFDTNTDPFWVNVSFTNPSNGKSYTFNIDSNDDGSDYWASKVIEVSGGGNTPSSDKIYESTLSAEYLFNEIYEGASVNQSDLLEFINIIEKSRAGYIVKAKTDIGYTGRDAYGSVVFSVSGINYSEGDLNVAFCSLGFITPDGFMLNIEMKKDGSGYLWMQKVINIKSIVGRGNGTVCALSFNSSTGMAINSGALNIIKGAPFLLILSPRWTMLSTLYGCDISSVFIVKDVPSVVTLPTYQLSKSEESGASVQVTITSTSLKVEIISGTNISGLTAANAVIEYI